MSRKYIKQIINQDFVYPNNEVSEYDIELIQDFNSNVVSGTVTNFSATTVTTSNITLNLNYTWSRNGAEPWVRNSAANAILSVHCSVPGQTYYKPWRVVGSQANTILNQNSYSGNFSIGITPSMFGLTSFTNGTYYFEFRFIGHLAVYPICANLNLTPVAVPTPTPTPTPTVTPTPTPTPTPGGPTATPTPTPTPTSTPAYIEFNFCGRGNSIADACNDAVFNSRTFYSNCTPGSFGVGCYVYIDNLGTLLTGYDYIFMNGANWDIDTATGIVSAYSSIQC